ncbi:MAG: hypothetical protein AM326_00195 [Candidatus Thorarchaeota archaeon SMTZ-45]|nr:MAG: hypothetical protein AM326_00195 [Candidatus Thorarchaeota archaeon SMTZ-45]
MNFLITGGCGYIGSLLIRKLPFAFNEKTNVTILDNLSSGKEYVLANLPSKAKYKFIKGDIRKKEDLQKALDKTDVVIHLAALTGSNNSFNLQDLFRQVNYEGTKALMETCLKHGVERVIYASSCNIYGGKLEKTKITEQSAINPPNPYAKSKYNGELECLKYFRKNKLPVTCLRLATNYGWSPGIRFNLTINLFTFKALIGDNIPVFGSGDDWRPFIHVQDTVRAIIMTIKAPEDVVNGEIFNVGSNEENYRINQIAEMVKDAVVNDVEIVYIRKDDPPCTYNVDFSKIKSILGFDANFSVLDGIKEIADRFQQLRQ